MTNFYDSEYENRMRKNVDSVCRDLKGPFTPKVKLISLGLKEVPLHLNPNSSQHGDRRAVSKKMGNKETSFTYLKKSL